MTIETSGYRFIVNENGGVEAVFSGDYREPHVDFVTDDRLVRNLLLLAIAEALAKQGTNQGGVSK